MELSDDACSRYSGSRVCLLRTRGRAPWALSALTALRVPRGCITRHLGLCLNDSIHRAHTRGIVRPFLRVQRSPKTDIAVRQVYQGRLTTRASSFGEWQTEARVLV